MRIILNCLGERHKCILIVCVDHYMKGRNTPLAGACNQSIVTIDYEKQY